MNETQGEKGETIMRNKIKALLSKKMVRYLFNLKSLEVEDEPMVCEDEVNKLTDQIISLFLDMLPEEKGKQGCVGFIEDDCEWNDCLSEIKDKLRGGK